MDETSSLPAATGVLLGSTTEDINGSVWLLGHDLKSPVSIIISALEVILMLHEDDEAFADMLPLIKGALSAANRQHNMISDMLDLARLEIQALDMSPARHDLRDAVQEALKNDAYALETKQLKLSVELGETPLPVQIDFDLFVRVVSALMDNTLKFTIKHDALAIRAFAEKGQAVLEFSDSGRALLPAYEQGILERAPQWTMRQAGSRTSVGMGTPFVAAAVKAHKGTCTAHTDTDSKRTTFRITLPLADDTPD